MPDTFKTVTTGPHNDRSFLSATRAPLHGRKVVTHQLKCIEHIIEVLHFRDRSKTAHCHTDGLSQNGDFADSGVTDPEVPILRLKTGKPLIHIAKLSDVFAEGNNAWITFQRCIEAGIHDLASVDLRTFVFIGSRKLRYRQDLLV